MMHDALLDLCVDTRQANASRLHVDFDVVYGCRMFEFREFAPVNGHRCLF